MSTELLPSGLSVPEAIASKRDGARLESSDIEALLRGFTEGSVSEAQMAALAMAVCWRDLDADELASWCGAMVASGTRHSWEELGRPVADKHSTGGVGDKLSLVIAPLLAAAGCTVPMLSGRGLGHTGGTLDKIEAIPGLRVELSEPELRAQLAGVGCVIAATTPDLAPADRLLYALRDVTGTVASPALIASSIMSKKIASGARHLVLDVKHGSGAFLSGRSAALDLAGRMVALGEASGVATQAVLTPMDAPLGRACGNAVEVAEALETLRGGGPWDVRELSLLLADAVLCSARGLRRGEALEELRTLLDSGVAHEVFVEMVTAQGGNPRAHLPEPSHRELLRAETGGVLQGFDALAVGRCVWHLGAGRSRPGEPVDPTAGVILHPPGEVSPGDALVEVHTSSPALPWERLRRELLMAARWGEPATPEELTWVGGAR